MESTDGSRLLNLYKEEISMTVNCDGKIFNLKKLIKNSLITKLIQKYKILMKTIVIKFQFLNLVHQNKI